MLLALVAAVVGLGVGGFYLWVGSAPPEVRAPEVTGIDLRAAEQILARRGLVGQVVTHRYDEQAPAGRVVKAAPAAGRIVRQGRVIELIVSDGPPWVRMPDVREMELARARKAVSEADLRLARIRRRYDDALPAGWVVHQLPRAGARVARGESVELVVSAGPRPRVEPVAVEGEAKHAVVQVTLPEGDRASVVRIEVKDDRGLTVPYSEWIAAGSTINEVVTGYGEATARVYVDGKLIEEKQF